MAISFVVRHYFLQKYSLFLENNNMPRTQNYIKVWRRPWECLVGSSRVGVFRFFENSKKNNKIQNMYVYMGLYTSRRTSAFHRYRNNTINREGIKNIISHRENVIVLEFLRGTACNTYCIIIFEFINILIICSYNY